MDAVRPVNVTATAVVQAGITRLRALNVGIAAAGQTVKLHDCAATGDASTGNRKATIALDTAQSWHWEDATFYVGLVAVVSGGTTDITFVV